MIWWGPAGIGATYTIERYAEQHAGPFRDGLTDKFLMAMWLELLRVALVVSLAGQLTLTPAGGFMGMPATCEASDMRVIDMYRRSGDKLTENWIFIDLLHFWYNQGVDILSRLPVLEEFKFIIFELSPSNTIEIWFKYDRRAPSSLGFRKGLLPEAIL